MMLFARVPWGVHVVVCVTQAQPVGQPHVVVSTVQFSESPIVGCVLEKRHSEMVYICILSVVLNSCLKHSKINPEFEGCDVRGQSIQYHRFKVRP